MARSGLTMSPSGWRNVAPLPRAAALAAPQGCCSVLLPQRSCDVSCAALHASGTATAPARINRRPASALVPAGPLTPSLAPRQVSRYSPSSDDSSAATRSSVATSALPGILATLAVSPYRDVYCAVAAAIGATIWVKIFNTLAKRGVLDQVG